MQIKQVVAHATLPHLNKCKYVSKQLYTARKIISMMPFQSSIYTMLYVYADRLEDDPVQRALLNHIALLKFRKSFASGLGFHFNL